MPRKKAATATATLTADSLLSLSEAATRLGIASDTLRKAARRGRLRVEHLPIDGKRRYTVAVYWGEVEQYKAGQAVRRSRSQRERRARETEAQRKHLDAIARENLLERERLLAQPGGVPVPVRRVKSSGIRRGTYIMSPALLEHLTEVTEQALEDPAMLAAITNGTATSDAATDTEDMEDTEDTEMFPEYEVSLGVRGVHAQQAHEAEQTGTYPSLRAVYERMLTLSQRQLLLTNEREALAREQAALNALALHWDERPTAVMADDASTTAD